MPKISPPASTVAEYHGSQNPVKILGTFFSIFLYIFVSSARLQVDRRRIRVYDSSKCVFLPSEVPFGGLVDGAPFLGF